MTIVIEDCRVEVAPIRPGDAPALAAMVGRCSPGALYHRFHGAVGSPERAATLLTGHGQEVYLAWWRGRCVGVASLAEGPDGSPHLGVLVEDGWQRRGVGSALIRAAVARARERGALAVAADVMFEDRFILGLLARMGPVRTAASNPGYSATVDLRPEAA